MRAWKLIWISATMLLVLQYCPVYYRTSQFEHYLKEEMRRTHGKEQLKRALLDKAGDYSLPVTADDIRVTATGGVFRVDVTYMVPVNLGIYRHEMTFHTTGAGLLRQ